jgi:uncharacterized protein (DUF488 family)
MGAATAGNERYFTIGHSSRSVAEIAKLLREAGADCIVDVRTVPRSRTNPQFNADVFPASLAAQGLGYYPIAELGGLRKRRKSGEPSPNAYWENLSFRNYADYAGTEEFHNGLEKLRTLAVQHRPAIMCAEAVWWRCHRRIIADYLLAAGADVRHILTHGKIEPAHMTESAVSQPDGGLIYPAHAR